MEPPVNCNVPQILFLVFLVSATAAAAPANGSFSVSDSPALPAEPYTITLFIPSPTMVHSDQVLDQINTPDGGILLATSFGLSAYNGTWSTRHINRDNVSEGLMDDFVTAVEYDNRGNLWIGYSGGIQIYNGIHYQTLSNQQVFKDLQIQDLQRWHDDMWVATGNAGIHRYRDGTWTWFQPMSKGGPGFYKVGSLALDPAGDALIIATVREGLWIVESPDDPVRFEQIAQNDGTYGNLEQVRRDQQGGVYFFNDTSVVRFTPAAGFRPVLTAQDLSREELTINDLTSGPDGKLYLATDDGIYIWQNNGVYRHLNRFEGIGTTETVRTITIDTKNRVWFSTHGYVGFYLERAETEDPIPINIVTPATQPLPETLEKNPANRTTTPTIQSPQAKEGSYGSEKQGLAPILDPIISAINSILEKLGLKPGSP
jgi:hypothetical protein